MDVLLNTLVGFSRDFAGLKRVTVGGVNEDWPLPPGEDDEGMGDEQVGGAAGDFQGRAGQGQCTGGLWHD